MLGAITGDIIGSWYEFRETLHNSLSCVLDVSPA